MQGYGFGFAPPIQHRLPMGVGLQDSGQPLTGGQQVAQGPAGGSISKGVSDVKTALQQLNILPTPKPGADLPQLPSATPSAPAPPPVSDADAIANAMGSGDAGAAAGGEAAAAAGGDLASTIGDIISALFV